MIYNTTFLCTYHLHDKENQEDMYRIQLLDALKMNTWNQEEMNEKMIKLYTLYKNHPLFIDYFVNYKKECLETNIFAYLESVDDELLFLSSFNFDNFYKIHKLFIKIIN